MTEEQSIQELTDFLTEHGFTVERIPASDDEKRPDLAIRRDGELYLVEQKTKGDDPTEREAEREALKQTPIIDRAKPLRPRNRLSAILNDALKQIEAHPDADRAFKMVWITLWGVWSEANSEALFKGLYGATNVFDVDSDAEEMSRCYYMGYSDLLRLKEIDAVVVVDGRTMQIFANEFSPRYEAFMQSNFVETFRPGVLDPRAVVESGDAYSLIDFEGDRRDSEACLDHLAAQLGVKRMIQMDMNEFQVVANVDTFIDNQTAGDSPNS